MCGCCRCRHLLLHVYGAGAFVCLRSLNRKGHSLSVSPVFLCVCVCVALAESAGSVFFCVWGVPYIYLFLCASFCIAKPSWPYFSEGVFHRHFSAQPHTVYVLVCL